MTREQQLAISLGDVLDLIDTNELVRNPKADHLDDWLERMVRFVRILKRAHDLVKSDSKDPAKVVSIRSTDKICAVCRTRMIDAPGIGPYCPNKLCANLDGPALPAPGGCVSIPDQHFKDNQKVLQTLSEKMQDDLEPLPINSQDTVIVDSKLQNSNLKFAV